MYTVFHLLISKTIRYMYKVTVYLPIKLVTFNYFNKFLIELFDD